MNIEWFLSNGDAAQNFFITKMPYKVAKIVPQGSLFLLSSKKTNLGDMAALGIFEIKQTEEVGRSVCVSQVFPPSNFQVLLEN